jgi:hypothetical protein
MSHLARGPMTFMGVDSKAIAAGWRHIHACADKSRKKASA